jgi:hypothetical protein
MLDCVPHNERGGELSCVPSGVYVPTAHQTRLREPSDSLLLATGFRTPFPRWHIAANGGHCRYAIRAAII